MSQLPTRWRADYKTAEESHVMKLDWSRKSQLNDANVVLHKKLFAGAPRVTIGVPTYRRPDTLRRTLTAITRQTFREYIVVISDNMPSDMHTLQTVERFSDELSEVVLVSQKDNLGALGNMNFLLSVAETDYFLWIADDDEVSPNYLEDLVRLLDENASATTAMGQWISMKNPHEGSIRKQLRPETRNRALRLFKFISGEADDSAFYGLHRTEYLRGISFPGYFSPNRDILTNCCYVFLFDLLLKGHFAYTDDAAWICHNYSDKHYSRSQAMGAGDRLRTLIRRINLYLIYLVKTARKAPLLVPIVFVASVLGLMRDVITASWRFCIRVRDMGKLDRSKMI